MIVGIDLGTSNSLISVFRDGKPELIPNAVGNTLTPSVVGFDDDGEILVGAAARDRLVTHPGQTASQFKRAMGTAKAFSLGKRKTFSAEDLSALVLRDLKASAEAFLETEVTAAVISVPAYFNDLQRQSTMRAGAMAGLDIKCLINEPTAAALAYGLVDMDGAIKDDESSFLVFDLGGGTFDVSVLELFEGVLEVRASTGDAFLGGEDFTAKLADHISGLLIGEKDKEPTTKELGRIYSVAENIKHKLGLQPEYASKIVFRDEEQEISLTRKEFEKLCEPLVQKLRRPLQRAVADAGIQVSELDRILLVGGATRMQVIKDMVARLFGKFPEFGLNPDEVVALGAAVQGALVDKDAALADVVMTDVAPFTLGIETSMEVMNARGKMERDYNRFSPIIERNTVVPVSREEQYNTLQDNQTRLQINVFQGESPRCTDNISLGKIEVTVPRNKAGEESVDVRFTYDPSGLLEVEVTVTSTGQKSQLVIEGQSKSLDKSEIKKRLKELENLKVHPRDLAENKALKARIERVYEMTLGSERTYVGNLSGKFNLAIQAQDKHEISATRKEIAEALDDIESGFEL